MDIRDDTQAYLPKLGIDEQEYITNPFMQGGVAFCQWMTGKFRDDSLLENPYPAGTDDHKDWETGFDDWADD